MARLGVVGLLLAVLAVTPLGSTLAGGWFETWLPGAGHDLSSLPTVRVELQDATGLVRAIGPAPASADGVTNLAGNMDVLVATWLGGCGDYLTHLTFQSDGGGYLVGERTDEFGCAFMIGCERSVAIYLWGPVAAVNVHLIDLERAGRERETR